MFPKGFYSQSLYLACSHNTDQYLVHNGYSLMSNYISSLRPHLYDLQIYRLFLKKIRSAGRNNFFFFITLQIFVAENRVVEENTFPSSPTIIIDQQQLLLTSGSQRPISMNWSIVTDQFSHVLMFIFDFSLIFRNLF